MKTEVYTTFG